MNETTDPKDVAVTLREITTDNLRPICGLAVAPDQNQFVASNAVSIAEASFYDHAWFRAIYADDTPVGFVMLSLDFVKPEYYLWRFMIDARYQGRGFGERSLALVIDYVRSLPEARELLLSYVPNAGNPAPFYARLGFEETGQEVEGERVMRLSLRNKSAEADFHAEASSKGVQTHDGPASSVSHSAPIPSSRPPSSGEVLRPSRHAVWNPSKMGKSTLFQSDRALVGLNAFEPGQEHALHAHAGMDKIYYVLRGEGRFLLEGREQPMHAGDMLIAPEGMPHGVRNNGSERLLVLAVLATG